MSYFIIIRGPLGCGKTAISKRLSEILNAEYISVDKILEENNLDKVGPEEETISAENFIKANEMILPRVKETLQNGKIVIFDGNFQHKEALEHLIDNLPFQHFVFTLHAPVEVCIDRDKNRIQSYGEDSVRALHMLVSRFEYGTVIDVTKSLDESVAQILGYLPK